MTEFKMVWGFRPLNAVDAIGGYLLTYLPSERRMKKVLKKHKKGE